MKEIKVTNMVKFFTVLLLYENPTHGYNIIKETSNKLNMSVSSGQIYPFLQALEKRGYITSEESGSRDRKTYSLTPKGMDFVKRMLSRFGDLIDIAVEPKLTVCAHCGCEVYKGGHREQIKGEEMTFCCMHCAASYQKER